MDNEVQEQTFIFQKMCAKNTISKMYVKHLPRTTSYYRNTYVLAPFLHIHWWWRTPFHTELYSKAVCSAVGAALVKEPNIVAYWGAVERHSIQKGVLSLSKPSQLNLDKLTSCWWKRTSMCTLLHLMMYHIFCQSLDDMKWKRQGRAWCWKAKLNY